MTADSKTWSSNPREACLPGAPMRHGISTKPGEPTKQIRHWEAAVRRLDKLRPGPQHRSARSGSVREFQKPATALRWSTVQR